MRIGTQSNRTSYGDAFMAQDAEIINLRWQEVFDILSEVARTDLESPELELYLSFLPRL